MSISKCLHCGKAIGIRRYTGARFCSDEHSRAEHARLQHQMLKRLNEAAARFQASIDNPRPRRVKRDSFSAAELVA